MDRKFPTGDRQCVISVNQLQKVVIQNRCGEKLVGILHDTGCKEIVIICHGFRSSKESPTVVNIAVALVREGFSVFRFDFSGHGESEGSFHLDNYLQEADDLHSIVEHFSNSQRRIAALVGHSKGGNVVLFYASKSKDIRIPAVVNISGCFDLERRIDSWFGTGYLKQIRQNGFTDIKNKKGKLLHHVTRDNLKARLAATRTAALSMNKNCRVLTVHGSLDEVTPAADALEFSKLVSNHELEIIEGADHEFSSHQNELVDVAVKFIKAGFISMVKMGKGSSLIPSRI